MPNDQQTTGEPGGCSARPACSAVYPKYRIVTDRFSGYEVQEKTHWWLPWIQLGPTNTSSSTKAAEAWLLNFLEGRSRHRRSGGVFVKYISPPNVRREQPTPNNQEGKTA